MSPRCQWKNKQGAGKTNLFFKDAFVRLTCVPDSCVYEIVVVHYWIAINKALFNYNFTIYLQKKQNIQTFLLQVKNILMFAFVVWFVLWVLLSFTDFWLQSDEVLSWIHGSNYLSETNKFSWVPWTFDWIQIRDGGVQWLKLIGHIFSAKLMSFVQLYRVLAGFK